ncbi:MAG TPA: DegT/DnrJ/EryC1/StrS family aminotransferase, partial [Candidatus Paceibacterota bacterium]
QKLLKDVSGISFLSDMKNVTHGYSYFPILVDEEVYGMSRDALYDKLKENNVFARRYFYPLISSFEPYRELPSATSENLPVATKAALQVLCLPIYVELDINSVNEITSIIKNIKQSIICK